MDFYKHVADGIEDASLMPAEKARYHAKAKKRAPCARLPPPIVLPEPPNENCRKMRSHVIAVMDTVFHIPLGNKCELSYTDTYSKVYDCVCGGRGSNLFKLLLHLVTERCRQINASLHDVLVDDFDSFLTSFYRLGMQFKQAVQTASALFKYLDRSYVDPELQSSLESEWMDVFRDFTVVDPAILDKLRQSLATAAHRSLAVEPIVLMCITQQLHEWDPNYTLGLDTLRKRYIAPQMPRCSSSMTRFNRHSASRTLETPFEAYLPFSSSPSLRTSSSSSPPSSSTTATAQSHTVPCTSPQQTARRGEAAQQGPNVFEAHALKRGLDDDDDDNDDDNDTNDSRESPQLHGSRSMDTSADS